MVRQNDGFLLPSEYMPGVQIISPDLVFYKLAKILGRPPNAEDRRFLARCKCVEDFVTLLTETYVGDVLIKGSSAGLGRLGEFYVALRCDKAVAWEPNAGYDLWGAWRLDDLVEAGKVEVKTCGILPVQSHAWRPRIAGYLKEFVADVVIFIGMTDSLNPCRAKVFVVPKSALIDTFHEQKARFPEKHRPRIGISRSELNLQTKARNRWYEFLLPNHINLKDRIAEHMHGKQFIITPAEQLTLF